MTESTFYAAGPDEQVALNLFHGWGYNFYRAENQLRADDLMVRARVGEMLSAARASVEAAEAAFRREHIHPPSRAQPLPDPDALREAQFLEATSRAIGALEGRVRALPVPEADRMTQRLRDERATLQALLRADLSMVAMAHKLRTIVAAATAACVHELGSCLAEISAALQARQDVLKVVG